MFAGVGEGPFGGGHGARRLALVPDRRIRQVLRQGRRHRHRPAGRARIAGASGGAMSTLTAPAAPAPCRPVGSAAEGEALMRAPDGGDGRAAWHGRARDRAGARRQACGSRQARSRQGRAVGPIPRRRHADQGEPDLSRPRHAATGGRTAPASRPVPRRAADEPHGAGDGACGLGKHHARRFRGARPQGDAAGLWRLGPRHGAEAQRRCNH